MADGGFRFCGEFNGGFRFCSGFDGWVLVLWVCGYGFVDVGLWVWVCGGCGLRWVGFGGHGFRGSVIKVFRLWAWGVRWIRVWVAGDEGVPACVAWVCWVA